MEQPQAMNKQNEVLDGPVAILWDIENCPVPNDVHAEDVACNIRMALRMHPVITGAVTKFSAYGDFNAFPIHLREGCQRTGVKLVDVPNGRKDAADKAILIDMFLFALDNGPPSTILLISGDGDFAAALHILGQRGYSIIVVSPSRSSSSALRNAGRFVWDWETVVRGGGSGLPNSTACRTSYSFNYNMSHNPDIQQINYNSHPNVKQKLTDNNMGIKTDSQNGEHAISQANIDQMHSYSSMDCDTGENHGNENTKLTIVCQGISRSNLVSQANINKNQSYILPQSPGGDNAAAFPHLPHFQNRKQGQRRWNDSNQLGEKQGLGFIKNQLVRLLVKFGGRMRYRQLRREYKVSCGRSLCWELQQHGIRKLGILIMHQWSNTFFFLRRQGCEMQLCLRMPIQKHVNQHKNPTEGLIPCQLQNKNDPLSNSSEVPNCQPQSAIHPEPGDEQPLQGPFQAVLTGEQGICQAEGGDGSLQCPQADLNNDDQEEREETLQGAPSLGHEEARQDGNCQPQPAELQLSFR